MFTIFTIRKFNILSLFVLFTLGRLIACYPRIYDGPNVDSSAELWRSQSIYQIVTDRFARTDGSTSYNCSIPARKYCGGTYQGIIDKLDYIQGMGFTAIWISPVVKQIPGYTYWGEAFHGYWMENLYELNPHFGSPDDLKNLSSELHKRDMLLMVDVVYNHYAFNGTGTNVNYTMYTPFNDEKYFHSYCLTTDYTNQTNIELCWEGDVHVSLPDLKTEDSYVISTFQEWVSKFVSEYSIDGLRIDSAAHVDDRSLTLFENAANVYTIGEVNPGNVSYACPYQQYMKGILNYPLFTDAQNFFTNSSITSYAFTSMVQQIQSNCLDVSLLGTFIENQDQIRIPTLTSDKALIKNAMAYPLLLDGIPIIYYGQEQGFAGENDPYNRAALWPSGYNNESEYYRLFSVLNYARSLAISLDSDYTTYKSELLYTSDHTIAMRKGKDGSQLISVLSNLGSNSTQQIYVSNTGFSADSEVYEIISCKSSTTDSEGNLWITVTGDPQVYVSETFISGSSICNKTVSSLP